MRSISIFILYDCLLYLQTYQYTTFCNKDSHVMKKARWSCRRRNPLSCSSCGGNSETLFLTKGFSRIYTGARHSWDILMADFYLDSGGLRLDNLNLFKMYIIFLSKTSDLRLKCIEQAKEQYGYLHTISKSTVVYLINLRYDDMDTYTQFQNQQFVHIIYIPLWKFPFHQPNLCQRKLLYLDDHCHGSLVCRLSFLKSKKDQGRNDTDPEAQEKWVVEFLRFFSVFPSPVSKGPTDFFRFPTRPVP